MSDDPFAHVLRRHFVAVATAEYDNPPWSEWGTLPIAGEVSQLAGWLSDPGLGDRRFRVTEPHLAANPNRNQVRDFFEGPVLEWRDTDAAVVFVTGHGEYADGHLWMIFKTTEDGAFRKSAWSTGDLLGLLRDSGVVHLLLVLDVCHAGQLINDVARYETDIPPTWLVLPTAARDQKAFTGALTAAVIDFLDELAAPEGGQYGLRPYLDVGEFVEGVNAKLGPSQRMDPLQGSQRAGQHACLPNPHFAPGASVEIAARRRELALPRQDLLIHWGPRSRGVDTDATPGWLFIGRVELMRELISITSGTPGVVLVTGRAGSGKSAVLARLVTLSDPQFRHDYATEVDAIPPELVPQLGSVAAAVLATGRIGTEVLAQLSDALDAPRPQSSSPTPTLAEWTSTVAATLAGLDWPVTIVVDALDEADNPSGVVQALSAVMADPAAAAKTRLILGIRSVGGSDVPSAAGGGGTTGTLVEQAERLFPAVRRIRVDDAPWWRQDDVSEYVTEVLTQTAASPYADEPAAAARVAGVISEHVGISFLVARLAAADLTTRHTSIDPTDGSWLRSLDAGVVGVFRNDLHRARPDPGDRLTAVHLLRAVAFAYGKGLPWRQIWPLVADAVADDPDRSYGDTDIAALLDSRLGAYLVTDVEDDTTVYRLFHDALRDALRDDWAALLTDPTST